jgi:hypothetical protein
MFQLAVFLFQYQVKCWIVRTVRTTYYNVRLHVTVLFSTAISNCKILNGNHSLLIVVKYCNILDFLMQLNKLLKIKS